MGHALLYVRRHHLGLLALFVALGGTSYAASVPRNSVTSASVRNGSLTGADVKNRSLTKADFRGSVRGARGARGATGPVGPTGPAGQAGAPGAAGTNGTSALRLFASVDENQVVVRSNPTVTVLVTSVGLYRVDFGRDVSNCTPIAAIGATSAGNNTQPGEIAATSFTTDVNKVTVRTRDSAGVGADKPFQLALACP